ncbi:bromodomain-containing protein DDB_G0270170-like isoform X2 [Trichogramma pretiosum]|uniref:bromodomain-containing protein DDB_G0270170-like isoform X2 n=1 Tax=Trichogramma pretiosum TaxID=7493 RepID=UPI0006C96885|nr:bromodomain-containing protein DDB_G0270170-like isoform X2 [Trichogramma pretiosum]
MVVSHREGNISSNIRAIIEQLNLNPTERDRLQQCSNNSSSIKQQQIQQRNNHHIASPMMMRLAPKNNHHRPEAADRPRVTIGVYGLNNHHHNNNNNNNNNNCESNMNSSNDSCEPKQWSKKIQYDNVEEYKHEKKVLIRKFEANNNVVDLQVAKRPIKKVNDIGDIENSANKPQIVTKNNKLDKEMENIIKKAPELRKVLPTKIDNANNKLESFLSKPAWSVKPSNNKIEGILKKPMKKIEDCVNDDQPNDASVITKKDVVAADDNNLPKKPIWKIDDAKKKVEELSKQIMRKFENNAEEAKVSVINLTQKSNDDDGTKKNNNNDLRRPLKKIEDKDIKLMSVELVTELQKRKTVHRVVARPRQRQPAANEIVLVVPLPRKDATPSANSSILDDSGVSLKEDLPELPTGNLSHTAAHHRISVRPKNRRPPRRTTPTADATTAVPTTPTTPTTTTAPASSLTTATLLGESFAASSTSIDALDSLEEVSPTEEEEVAVPMTTTTTAASTPTTPVVVTPIVVPLAVEPSKPIPILRKSSSRISRNSDVFEELDHQKVPLRPKHQQQQTAACSPDSLESTTNLDSRSSADVLDDATKPPRPTPRSSSTSSDKSPARRSSAASNRLSKSPDSLESGSPMEWLAKSSNEGLFDMMDKEVVSAASKPVPARRSLLGPPLPVSKSQERVCSNTAGSKSDSLEALNNSDDSMERRQQHRHSSSGSIAFDLRPTRRSQHGHQHSKLMSKSTECFDTMIASAEQQQHPLLQQQSIVKIDEKRKRASCSEVNLSRGGGGGRFPAKLLSAESFEKFSAEASSDKLLLPVSLRRASGGGIVTTNNSNNNNNNNNNNGSGSSNKRMAHSSESSDNLELDDNCKLENRRRSTPKRLSRLRKNSESSELGSTDTLDSERRNHTMKSSDSDETLDSLEKDLLEPVLPVVVSSRKSKEEDELQSIQQCDNNSMVAVVERRDDNADETADTKVGAFWRRKTSSSGNQVVVESNKDEKADLDIHQLGGYLLAGNKIHENGNNDSKEDTTSPALVYAKKKQMQAMHLQQQQHQQQQQQAQQPSRGGGGGGGSEEQTKNNQLTNKSDEEVQNMLNGNISEVTTDTRSFKEKLIMFEKLGK